MLTIWQRRYVQHRLVILDRWPDSKVVAIYFHAMGAYAGAQVDVEVRPGWWARCVIDERHPPGFNPKKRVKNKEHNSVYTPIMLTSVRPLPSDAPIPARAPLRIKV